MSSQTAHQSADHRESRVHLVEPPGLPKLFLVSAFLAGTTLLADRLASAYLDRVQQIHTWNLAIHYSEIAAGLFLILQMICAVIVFSVPRQSWSVYTLKQLLLPHSVRPLLWGVVIGIGVSVGAIAFLFLFDKDVQFVRLVLDNPISFQTIFILILLGFLVPVATEVVFRGIIFDVLVRRTNAVSALLSSSLLFAYVWVLFDGGLALLIGIACGLLYRRFNSLVPCIVCSGTASVLAALILFLRLLL